MSIRNKKNQTAIDLCSDKNLTKVLNKHFKEKFNVTESLCQLKISDTLLSKQTTCSTVGMSSLSASNKSPDECLICSDNKREVLFRPCNHVAACESCGRRCKKCLVCKKAIEERVPLDECLVCSDRKASVLFRPCEHVCACEVCAPLMK